MYKSGQFKYIENPLYTDNTTYYINNGNVYKVSTSNDGGCGYYLEGRLNKTTRIAITSGSSKVVELKIEGNKLVLYSQYDYGRGPGMIDRAIVGEKRN